MNGSLLRQVGVGPFLALAAIHLSGCATIYKSTAGDYVDAAKQITAALQSAESSLANADKVRKGALIAEDRACPIARGENIYLRPAALNADDIPKGYFGGLSKTAGFGGIKECQTLQAHESDSAQCFSEDESYCIDQIQHYYATSAAAANATGDVKSIEDLLSRRIAAITYGAPLPDSYMAAASVQILTGYLDILGKAADGQAKDVNQQAKDLSAQIKTSTDTYKTVTGKDLLSSSTLASGQSDITALGAFAQDVANVVEIGADTAKIKVAVDKTGPDAIKAMKELKVLVMGDVDLAGAIANNQSLAERNQLQQRFQDGRSTLAERQRILSELASLPNTSTATVKASVTVVFGKAEQAHDTLVQLIDNPSQEQLQQIRAQQFASFRSAAEDLASLLLLLK
jgi:hypothetical protein